MVLGLLACAFARDVLLSPPTNRPPAPPHRWLLLLSCAALGLSSIAALLPPGVLWGDEPNGYDVLEYHLQIPREWYELGRIVPLHHNVFSFFPFNVEMHYLLAMALHGGPWSGMHLAQLMHVAFIALTVLAIYALIAERSKPLAIIAATAAATVPWMGLLAPVAYDEGGLLLWGTLAVGLSLRGSGNWRSMSLAGVMAGFACGAKLTAVPIVLLAVPLIHLALACHTPQPPQRRARFSKHVLPSAAYLLAASLVFSPWLLKNIAWVGNPVFPEETSLLGRGDWSQTQVDRWIRANHLPRPDQQNLPGRAAAGWNQILADWRYGFVLLPLAIFSAALTWKDRQTAVLFLLLIALAIFWLFFTHLQSRFFILAIPLSALLIGQIKPQRATMIVYSTIILLAALAPRPILVGGRLAVRRGGLVEVYLKLTSINPHLFDFIGAQNLSQLTPLEDTKIPSDTRVLLIGDARAFLYDDVPSDRLFYRTVFDVDAKPGQTSDQAWQSGWPSSGPLLQVIDAPELRRFARTYWEIPLPSPSIVQMPDATVK
jgi:hypothetical protein